MELEPHTKNMRTIIPTHLGASCVAAALLAALPASAATSATVSEVVKDVSISGRQANLGDTLAGAAALKTGSKSRAELTFQDTTLLRVGSNTIFSFLGSRGKRKEFNLQQGTAFVSAPERHGGVHVRCGGVTAAIEGCLATVSDNSGGVFVGCSEVTGKGVKIIADDGTALFDFESNTFWYAPRLPDGTLDLNNVVTQKYDSWAQLNTGWATEDLPEEIMEIAKRAKVEDYATNRTNNSPGTEKDPTDINVIDLRNSIPSPPDCPPPPPREYYDLEGPQGETPQPPPPPPSHCPEPLST